MDGRLIIVFAMLLMSGCSQLPYPANQLRLPSLDYCERVSYVRQGTQIELGASCSTQGH